jgi:hypothetical protein
MTPKQTDIHKMTLEEIKENAGQKMKQDVLE